MLEQDWNFLSSFISRWGEERRRRSIVLTDREDRIYVKDNWRETFVEEDFSETFVGYNDFENN